MNTVTAHQFFLAPFGAGAFPSRSGKEIPASYALFTCRLYNRLCSKLGIRVTDIRPFFIDISPLVAFRRSGEQNSRFRHLFLDEGNERTYLSAKFFRTEATAEGFVRTQRNNQQRRFQQGQLTNVCFVCVIDIHRPVHADRMVEDTRITVRQAETIINIFEIGGRKQLIRALFPPGTVQLQRIYRMRNTEGIGQDTCDSRNRSQGCLYGIYR